MKNFLFILLVFLSATAMSQGISLDWAVSMGGSSNDYAEAITVDADGNVYATGYFQGTVDFDPGSGTTNLTSAGGYDIFVTKFNAEGDLLWAKSMGGFMEDKALGIDVDINGNVYTTGHFHGTSDFNPGASSYNLSSEGGKDIFVSKLDSNGDFMWAGRFSGTSHNYGYDVAVDDDENMYLTGYFNGTVDFDPAPATNTFNLTTTGGREIYVVKLDITYNLVWAKKMGGTQSDEAYAITLYDDGNIYTTGVFIGTADFDPGSGVHYLSSVSSTLNDMFVSKLDNSGNFVWAKHLGGSSDAAAKDVAVDGNGNVFTTGRFDGYVDFDPGTGSENLTTEGHYDVFISKLDVNGDYVWAKNIGGADWDEGLSVTTDDNGDVYLTGYFESSEMDFDPGTGIFEMSPNGFINAFNLKLDAVGDFAWANENGGASSYGTSIAVSDPDVVHTAGYFQGTGDFDPGSGTFDLISQSGNDAYIQKLKPCASSSGTDVQTACDSYTWIDGNTYTENNNTATYVLTNAVGCDSIVTLDLTILNSTSSIDSHTACESFTWIDGNTYTQSNNTATHVLTNAAGCDSVVTLDLTINHSTTGVDTQVACDSFTWIDGNTYTENNNTATYILTNAAGCDSVILLELTINDVDATVSANGSTITANAAGASYQWLDCDDNYAPISGETSQSFTATSNGNYAVAVTQNGCTDTSDCVTISGLGIDANFANRLQIYPNPTHRDLYVELDRKYSTLNINVRNIVGQIVSSKRYNSVNQIDLKLNGKPGIYFVELNTENERTILKVIKE